MITNGANTRDRLLIIATLEQKDDGRKGGRGKCTLQGGGKWRKKELEEEEEASHPFYPSGITPTTHIRCKQLVVI